MRQLLSTLICLLLTTIVAAQSTSEQLKATHNSPNVIRVAKDTIYLAASTTYSFTVDTPQDEGLMDTRLKVENIASQLMLSDDKPFKGEVTDHRRNLKLYGRLVTGDNIEVGSGDKRKGYKVVIVEAALNSKLTLFSNKNVTSEAPTDIILDFVAGQRSPNSTVNFYIPSDIEVTPDNTFVNVIGRGEVSLRNLPTQSIGRTGTNYSYTKVGSADITPRGNLGSVITLRALDLRPLNGIDVRLRINTSAPAKTGEYQFSADYTSSEPSIYQSRVNQMSTTTMNVVSTISNLRREMPVTSTFRASDEMFIRPTLSWSTPKDAKMLTLMQSTDHGKSWSVARELKAQSTSVKLSPLTPNKLYMFKLNVTGGPGSGASNVAIHYSGMIDVKSFGAKADGLADDTEAINSAIEKLARDGGVLTFAYGKYMVRTIHLRSNVWLHVDKSASIECLRNADAPEATWFCDRAYRSGLSPTDPSPYADPENYLTKQDVGHTYFRNTMFFAERQHNIKIFGNGTISGNGNLVTGDRVMNNAPDNRADKMFTFKLCTHIEIGGYDTGRDMWYDAQKDEPYYIDRGGKRDYDLGNMLQIDRGGHFVLLATGSDTINVHDTYFGKVRGNARDIYDFMGCNSVRCTNIYSKMSSDDIVKLGSDCSLGFTRPVQGYMVRNIIGDTNCNLLQIGSETADDIKDVYVDNIYVLGSNKAGFSISTNDGAHVSNIHLNSGKTGAIHSRSVMLRTRAPFFISISNRGRVIGADVKRFKFSENGVIRDELLVINSNIGSVDGVYINDVDISEVYGGSSFSGSRWKSYDGTQNESTSIIAGYRLPSEQSIVGGIGLKLPNGKETGFISRIEFNRVKLLVKGGHPAKDALASPPEIGVGRYNVGDLKIQPSYGFWFRHAKNIVLKDCSISYQEADGRHAIVLDDVLGAKIENLTIPKDGAEPLIKTIGSKDVAIKGIKYR